MTSNYFPAEYRRGLVVLGTVVVCLLSIPLMVFAAAAVMLVLLWPMFLGAYIEFGHVPGQNPYSTDWWVSLEWRVLAVVWLVTLVAAPVLIGRYHRTLKAVSPRRTGPKSKPRARI